MKNKLLLCLFIFLIIPGISTGAELRTLEIDFTFTAPVYQDKELAGYTLYKEGAQVCQTSDPSATTITCNILTEDGTFNFTLTGYYTDNSESPPSPSFPFTIDSPTKLPSTTAEMRTLEIEFSFVAPYFTDKLLAGYKLYKEEVQVCETSDPAATGITCDILSEDGTFSFTLTGYYSDGSESPPSEPFLFTIDDSTPVTTPPLQAVISPTSSSGEVPLTVSFSGAGSTGGSLTYSWDFADGTSSSSTDPSAGHTYTNPGTYSATLLISDESGATSQATTTITARPSTTPPEPPTAVVSSSTAAGNAPLTVLFDGSDSTPDTQIVHYEWKFGDASEAAGETTSHTYLTAGTYHPELTVTDSQGLTDTVDTPVIVVATTAANEKPLAIISTSSNEGSVPLIVVVNGLQSSDPDGTIASYNWNFGDGTAKETGSEVEHTYTGAGTYTITLEVTDDKGATADTTQQIISNVAPPENIPNFEVGEINIDHEWVTVDFAGNFTQPVVIAGPPTADGSDPVLVRIRNITPESFDIRLQEWDYLNDSHIEETLTYIVMEKGVHTLDSGIKIEAGSFTGSSRFKKISLQQPCDTTPVILTQVITENASGAVTGRIRKSGQSSFEYKMQEQETTKKAHAAETIGYIAWEPGTGEIQGLLFEAGLTSKSITNKWSTLTFQTEFPTAPLFIADMQTCEGGDTAVLRTQAISNTATQIMVEEEQSKDSEISHKGEAVGYLVIGSR